MFATVEVGELGVDELARFRMTNEMRDVGKIFRVHVKTSQRVTVMKCPTKTVENYF